MRNLQDQGVMQQVSNKLAIHGLNVPCRVMVQASNGEVCGQQQDTSDLTLSQLYRWQHMLGVPVAELLVGEGQKLSDPVRRRAQLGNVMKTAATMKETVRDRATAFAPVKYPDSMTMDTPATARAATVKLHTGWLLDAETKVAPGVNVEISPLSAHN